MNNDSVASIAEKGDIDDYCNLSTLLCARIVNFLTTFQRSTPTFNLESYETSQKLWCELQEWRKLRPQTLCPLLRAGPTSGSPFPSVTYAQSSSGTLKKSFYGTLCHLTLVTVCGNIFYHAGSILLLGSGLLNSAVQAESVRPFRSTACYRTR